MVSSCIGIRRSLSLFISSTFSSSTLSSLIPSRRYLLTGIATGTTAFTISHNPKRTFASANDFLSCSTNKHKMNPLSSHSEDKIDTGYLSSTSAYNLDQELMSQPGFSLEQLMELAGLSVAEAAYHVLSESESESESKSERSILIVCGPGNNGGDGLVAARHLVHFGYSCTIVYPKQSKGDHFKNLVTQCQNVGIPVLNEIPENEVSSYDLIIDALFGFSFKGEPREPLATILRQIIAYQSNLNIPILSVDIPSGWHVEDGNISKDERYQFQPDILISLTAPKLCVKTYQGKHFIGGRFLPDYLAEKYEIKVSIFEM